MDLIFEAEHVAALLSASLRSTARLPCLSQMMNPDLWRQDLDPSRIRLLRQELETLGVVLSVSADDIDPSRIEPGLWLVGGEGVYLMSNAPIEDLRAKGIQHTAYAEGCDPGLVSPGEWIRMKRATFGGDDGVEFLSSASVSAGLPKAGKYRLLITPETMILPVLPKERRMSLPEAGMETCDAVGVPDL